MINIFTKNNNFIERSITGALSFLKESIFAEDYAAKKGLLQSIDPRIKILTFAVFLISVLFAKNISFLFLLYLFCLLIAVLSRINILFFLKRTWFFIPLFSLFIALPALFNFVSPGVPLVSFKILGLKLVITRQGLFGACFFIMRIATSVSFVVLLSLTTRHTELLKVLRIFGVPKIFVMTLGMCYRYIYLFISIIENTYTAIKSRAGGRIHYKRGQKVVAWKIASLWYRSYQLNEDVYSAMLSRGYNGEPKILRTFKTLPKDWVWLLFAVIFCSITFYYTAKM